MITDTDVKEFALILFCGGVCALQTDTKAASSSYNVFWQILEIIEIISNP